jgi:hypothetical protein
MNSKRGMKFTGRGKALRIITITAIIIALLGISRWARYASCSPKVVENQFDVTEMDGKHTLQVTEPCTIFTTDNITEYNMLMNGSLHPSNFSGVVQEYTEAHGQFVPLEPEGILNMALINYTETGMMKTLFMPKFTGYAIEPNRRAIYSIPDRITTGDPLRLQIEFDTAFRPGDNGRLVMVALFLPNYSLFKFTSFPNAEFREGDYVDIDVSDLSFIEGETDIEIHPIYVLDSEPGVYHLVGNWFDCTHTVTIVNAGRLNYLQWMLIIGAFCVAITAVARILVKKKFGAKLELIGSRYRAERNLSEKEVMQK